MRTEPRLIRSRGNAKVRALVNLAGSSRERRATGTTLIEGERLVRAFVDAGGTAATLVVGESAYARPEMRALFDSVPATSKLILSDRLADKVSQVVSPAGIAAVISTPRPQPLPRQISTCVLLENVQDPGNLGSVLRSAAAAGVKQVFLSSGSVFAWSPKVLRAGMGAHFFLSIFENVDLAGLARDFTGRIVATEPRAEAALYQAELRGPIAWLFGNEASGLSEQARSLASEWVRIPMPGPAESLNLAAAVAICLFEQVRQNLREEV